MKIILYLLIIISLNYSVYTYIRIPYIIPTKGYSCHLPISFSIEHKCDLQFDSHYSKDIMKCISKNGNYYNLKIDCKGGIISSEEIIVYQPPQTQHLLLSWLYISIIILTVFRFFS